MTRNLPATATPVVDSALERAQFLFELDLLELTMTIPQAAPTAPVAKY